MVFIEKSDVRCQMSERIGGGAADLLGDAHDRTMRDGGKFLDDSSG
jgi:hypothetical protein